ncbi:glycoside hydrolase family 88/105 protein [Pontibacter harenae]|uniref:glycoside hydrolase family 88/105 protein n=1 Tax=Pontibacter harenae TaxID=2894083 RepID=UPI001E363FEF|nr:glycoside hydrolase family 88 protein [Pontibacter harenae]MCC9165800.1 glycoside hydrolase family 88 protein [Pontibacter harenae]
MTTSKTFVRISFFLCLFAFACKTQDVGTEKLPKKSKILETLTLANDYFMQKWPDPGKEIVTNKTRPSNIWTRGIYYIGLMELYEVDPKQKYYDYAVEWGQKHNWGLTGGDHVRHADYQTCGQTYIELYKIDQKPERIESIKASVDNMVNSSKSDDWTWIDALMMAMPLYAQLGEIYPQDAAAYHAKMYDLYSTSKTEIGGGLYNPEDGLWWRDADFVPPYKAPNGEDCYWSRGNGWVVGALVRVLDTLPKDAPHREEYEKTYLEMMEALMPLQREDGFWNVSLHDPNHFGGKETTGTALFTYGMAWGVNNGLLDPKMYKPAIAKAWNAMEKEAVHPNGFLGYVQGTGKEPKDGQPVSYTSKPDFEDYGLGCFLLAGTEIIRMK